ncbi:MAG: heme ABC exporter ATP-binding protein CcmA [Acidimicrobiales bacterium]
MAPAVRLRRVVALLGRFPALAGVDLDVARGEVVLIQGANGSGKTSLLRTCAGLAELSDGEAEVLGRDLRSDRRAVRRAVGLLGHATSLYDDLSVVENVEFGVRAAGGDRDRVAPALARLGLDGRLRRLGVSRLSAGQRRRVAIAVLVARAPALWLLDEPHAGLDAEGRDLVDELVAEVVAGGATVLMASHEADRAVRIAGRRVVMAGGQVYDAPPPVAGDANLPPVLGDATLAVVAANEASVREAIHVA